MLSDLARRMGRPDLAAMPAYQSGIIASSEYQSGAPMGIPSPSSFASIGSDYADPTTGRAGLSILAMGVLGLVAFYVLTRERQS